MRKRDTNGKSQGTVTNATKERCTGLCNGDMPCQRGQKKQTHPRVGGEHERKLCGPRDGGGSSETARMASVEEARRADGVTSG